MKERMRAVVGLLGIARKKIGDCYRKHTKKIIGIGIVLVILLGWACTGWVIVPAQTVRVVRCPDRVDSGALVMFERPTAIINDTDSTQIKYVCPWIPGTGIGAREESYPLDEPLDVNAEIKLFSVYDLTGDPADKGKVAYLVVNGYFEVTDWETFLLQFDPKLLDEEFQTMDRSELMALNLGMYLFGGNVNNWYVESISRTYLAQKFAKEYNLETEEEIEYFLKVYRSWYWCLGAMYFYQFEEELMRNPFPNPYVYELAYRCVLGADTENAINDYNRMLSLVEYQKAVLCAELDPGVIEEAEAIIAEFKTYLEGEGMKWPVNAPKEKLSEFLVINQMREGANYSSRVLYAARVLVELETEIDNLGVIIEQLNEQAAQAHEYFSSLRLWYSKGNDSLWRFAIQRVVQGKGFPSAGDFYPWLKTDGMEYLVELAEFYQELGYFESLGVEFNNITFTIEEVVEEPQE